MDIEIIKGELNQLKDELLVSETAHKSLTGLLDMFEKQLILSGVVKSFTAEQVLKELEDEENIYDARKYFKSLL